ncbi:DEAD/DEAH box helicase [bacterium]|jgi:ATP-dependent RNA helicase DeaD|nr:DEAD/DEAH box helicase [bacterium]
MTKTTFDSMGLSDVLLKALTKKGFTEATDIQAQTIPLMLSDERDVIGQAQTGTGKTAAFGLPILEQLRPSEKYPQALIMAPTRELAIQVADELHELKGEKNLRIVTVYGGASIEKQTQQLRKPTDIVVGTPGRLMDHLRGKRLNLSEIKFVVLDEADEMLKTGFEEDIEWILSKTNPDHKTLLFSATMPPSILSLAKKYMKEYVTVQAKKETLATSLTTQQYLEIRESNKLEALCRVMDVAEGFYGLIFCRTKRDVDTVAEKLVARGYEAESMHGDLSQFQRERVLKKFRAKQCQMLVVTDVASRGLDISGLSHVVNYALPQDAETYVHRVGRTGRAGQSGTAITFVTPSEYRKLQTIQKIAKTKIEKMEVPDVKTIIVAKQTRLKERIEKTIEGNIAAQFQDFAKSILESNDPQEALAAILKVGFESTFTEKQYTDIKKGGGDRDRGGYNRSRGGGYQGKGGGGYQGKNKRYGSGFGGGGGGSRDGGSRDGGGGYKKKKFGGNKNWSKND